MTTTYSTVMQNEEYLTPEEYLERRKKGLIDPSKVRYAAGDLQTGRPGGFWVKLKTPRYAPEPLRAEAGL